MAGRRVETDRLLELIRLRRAGASARQIVRLLRMGPGTERRYRAVFAAAGVLAGPAEPLPTLAEVRAVVDAVLPARRPPPSPLELRRPHVERLMDLGLGARAIFDRLRVEARDGATPFRGSYSGTKRLCWRLRAERGVLPSDVVVPVETAPGTVQVDFGYAGRLYDPATGALRRAWAFVAVACHSRFLFARLVFDQKAETWLDLHRQAFEEMGNPDVVIPDNTRRAVLRAAFGIDGPTELERSYRELARHYGVRVDPCPPGAPRKKGKAEAAVKYVKMSALAGRAGEAFDEVQAALQRWCREVANVRVHGSTGRRPVDVHEQEERPALRPLPAQPYEPVVWKRARVHPDGHVELRGELFSVPWPLVGETLWLRARPRSVEVFHDDRLVTTHARTGRRRTTKEEHLPEGRRDLRHRAQTYWEARAERIGPETHALVREVFDRDPVLLHLRQVQAFVVLLERHPRRRAESVARLARHAGHPAYQRVKQMLSEALVAS